MASAATLFGLRMKDERLKAPLTQDELASKLDLSRVSIANYESGTQSPSLDTAIAIANELKFSLDEIAVEVRNSGLRNQINKSVHGEELKNQLLDILNKLKKEKPDGRP
jgi:transcriptional regulator with XRE-family HTH domain